MHTLLLVFEFLATTELMVIAVIALILFGPRKLPEIGRTVGKAIGEFKRASDDFKRTWEYEVEIERRNQPALETGAAAPAAVAAAADVAGGAAAPAPYDAEQPGGAGPPPDDDWGAPVARGAADDEPDGTRADARARRAGDEDGEINAS